jgi:hypothetical protein
LFLFLQAYRCESGPVLVRVLCVWSVGVAPDP